MDRARYKSCPKMAAIYKIGSLGHIDHTHILCISVILRQLFYMAMYDLQRSSLGDRFCICKVIRPYDLILAILYLRGTDHKILR